MPDFGTCWSATPYLTMPAIMVTGNRVVAEAIVRRWSTDRGGLIDDANYGFNLLDEVSDDIGLADLPRIGQQAGAEAEKDERVLSCRVTATFNAGVLSITGTVTTAQGPFQLVVTVDMLTVALLQPTPR